MYDLSDFGWDVFFEEQWRRVASAETMPAVVPARIAAEHRGGYEVWSARGEGRAQLAGRLRHELDGASRPSVGDWVALASAPAPDSAAVICEVLERRSCFTRGGAGRESGTQVVAANVDQVFIVCGLDHDFNLRRIERYLSRVWASGAQPAVVLSKADACESAAACAIEVEGRCPGVAVYLTSATRAEGLEDLRAAIRPGRTIALVGSSGAGKSTLINALCGDERLATGAVRASDGRGCHTTTSRQLVLLPGGGLLLDTPGMRELQLPDETGIDAVFGDIEILARRCRFGDCTHGGEPGCAVVAAVLAGELDTERLEHHRQLQREAQAYERRHDERLRRQADRAFGKMCREVKVQARLKRGE